MMTTEINTGTKSREIRNIVILILLFALFYTLCYFLEKPLHGIMAQFSALTKAPDHLVLRSEYTIHEQLSKYFLFLIILISAFIYRVSRHSIDIKLSISFMVLGLIMYLSESNIIIEEAQPILAPPSILISIFLLFRKRSWLSLFLFILGMFFIFFGVLTDIIHSSETIGDLLPNTIKQLFQPSYEERFDITGITLLCLSVTLCFRTYVLEILGKEKKYGTLLLISSGIMTAGNGFIHYQYKPSNNHFLAALLMTILGFLGITFSAGKMEKSLSEISPVFKTLACIGLFVFFVLVPSIHGKSRFWTAIILLLPSFLFGIFYLWRNHPINKS